MRYFPNSSSVEIYPLRGMGHTRIRVEDLEQIDVVRVRHVGPYREIGPCLERLFGWTANAGIRTGSILTLSCDDPDTVAQEDLRLDTCVEFFTNTVPPHRISLDLVQGGLCNPIRRVVHTKIFAKPIFECSDCDFRKIGRKLMICRAWKSIGICRLRRPGISSSPTCACAAGAGGKLAMCLRNRAFFRGYTDSDLVRAHREIERSS